MGFPGRGSPRAGAPGSGGSVRETAGRVGWVRCEDCRGAGEARRGQVGEALNGQPRAWASSGGSKRCDPSSFPSSGPPRVMHSKGPGRAA